MSLIRDKQIEPSLINDYVLATVSGVTQWTALSAVTGSVEYLNDLLDVTTGLPVLSAQTFADDGRLLHYDVNVKQWVSDDIVTHGTVSINAYGNTNIAKGTPVYLTGTFDNDLHQVGIADANNPNAMPVIGFAAEALTTSSAVSKHVITFGKLQGVDTTSGGTISGGESWTAGDILYISSTAGVLTKTRPVGATTQIQRIAQVLRVDASGGQLFIFNTARSAGLPNLTQNNVWVGNSDNQPVETGFTINNLTDTSFTSLSNNQLLQYNSGSGNWVNINPSVVQDGNGIYDGSGTLTGNTKVTIPINDSLEIGQSLFNLVVTAPNIGGNVGVQFPSFDSTKRPQVPLHVFHGTGYSVESTNFWTGTPITTGTCAIFQNDGNDQQKAYITIVGGRGTNGGSGVNFGDSDSLLSGRIFYRHGGDATHSANAMAFYTDATERMRIFNSGNVTIGDTLDKSHKLSVEGSIRINDGTAQNGYVLKSTNSFGEAVWGQITTSAVTSDSFVTNSYLTGTTLVFDRNDNPSAFSVDLSSLPDANGIYGGSGTVPSATTATLTNNLTFGSNLLYIDESNTFVGVNTATQSGNEKFRVSSPLFSGGVVTGALIETTGLANSRNNALTLNADNASTRNNAINIISGDIRYTGGTSKLIWGSDPTKNSSDIVGMFNNFITDDSDKGVAYYANLNKDGATNTGYRALSTTGGTGFNVYGVHSEITTPDSLNNYAFYGETGALGTGSTDTIIYRGDFNGTLASTTQTGDHWGLNLRMRPSSLFGTYGDIVGSEIILGDNSSTINELIGYRVSGLGTAPNVNKVIGIDIDFQTNLINATERYTALFNNGNVGIETTQPTANLQVGGTANTASFRYVDGNQANNYVLTSDASGNATWQQIGSGSVSADTFVTNSYLTGTTLVFDRNDSVSAFTVDLSSLKFTGNTSGDCITDIYATNIYGCSPLHIEPSGSNDVYIVENGGNVGIGTSTPLKKLDIVGGTIISTNTLLEGLTLNEYSGTLPNALTFAQGGTTTVVGATKFQLGVSNGNGQFMSGTVQGDSVIEATQKLFFTSVNTATPSMVLSGSNLGIGTSTPTRVLDVVGTSQFKGNALFYNVSGGTATTAGIGMSFGAFGANIFVTDNTFPLAYARERLNFQTTGDFHFTRINGASLFYIDQSGNVGIGTATPSATLDVVGTFQYVDGNEASGYVLTSDASGNATWQAVGADANFYTTGVTITGGTTLVFDRNDTSNAYNVDLSSMLTTGGLWTAGTGTVGSMVQAYSNSTSSGDKSVVGGSGNSSAGNLSVILGGFSHSITAGSDVTSIFGGAQNTIQGGVDYSVMVGGRSNILETSYGGMLAGQNNTLSGGTNNYSVVVGGSGNTLTAPRSAIIGGSGIIGTSNDTVYVPNFNINTTPSNDNALTQILVRANDGTVKYKDVSSFTDLNVTGGTYDINTGIVTFTNNSGGTFNVSGFTSGMTDSYTSAASLSGNTIVFDNNIQGSNYYNVDLSSLISGLTSKYAANVPMTGGTVETVTHSLGTTDITVQVKDSSGTLIIPDVVDNYQTNSVDINVSVTDTYRVIIIG